MTLSVEDFRKKYPGSTEEQVALYGAAVAAENARGPIAPEPDVPMPMITVTEVTRGPAPIALSPTRQAPAVTTYRLTGPRFIAPYLDEVPPLAEAPDLTTDIRRIVLGRRLTARERAQAERPDMSGDDLLALLAGVPNAREFEALEGGD